MEITYNASVIASLSTVTSITTTEADLVIITDPKFLQRSQLTAYYDVILGSATSVLFRYYVRPDLGTIWYEIPAQNPATGVLEDQPSAVDSTSPTQSTNIRTIDDIPVSACMSFKITGTSVGASATLSNLHVLMRDN